MVRLDETRGLVQTVDFFTPIVDDPYTFGAIAAANALSDVYAMGGTPISALNILCWSEALPAEVLAEVLAGGLAKVVEAGAVLAGGHSVADAEPKFGLAVTGIVDLDRIWANQGARPGDVLLLSKALGTGVVTTAAKRGVCPEEAYEAAVASMLALNRAPCDAARPLTVHAVTDITGFGLAGHAWEMARASEISMVFDAAAIPVLPDALRLAEEGHLTRGEKQNRRYVGEALRFEGIDAPLQSILVDPQTSGGLLLSLPEDQAHVLTEQGVARQIGRIEAGPTRLIFQG